MLSKLPPLKPRSVSHARLVEARDAALDAVDFAEGVTRDQTQDAATPVRRALPPLPPRKPLTAHGTITGRWPAQTAPANAPKADALPPPIVTARGQLSSMAYVDCPPARVLSIDWPWSFDDATPHKGAEDHYKTLTIEEIKKFPKPPVADNAVLFMWRVGGGNDSGSLGEAAYEVARSCGFTPKSEMAWIKTLLCKKCDARGWSPITHPSKEIQAACAELRIWCDACHGRGYKIAVGMGRYVRGAHEVCLIATRGKGMLPDDKSIRSVFFAPRREHSSKPDRFYEIVQKLYPEGPYVELFARRRREGWHQFGDELGKLDDTAVQP